MRNDKVRCAKVRYGGYGMRPHLINTDGDIHLISKDRITGVSRQLGAPVSSRWIMVGFTYSPRVSNQILIQSLLVTKSLTIHTLFIVSYKFIHSLNSFSAAVSLSLRGRRWIPAQSAPPL